MVLSFIHCAGVTVAVLSVIGESWVPPLNMVPPLRRFARPVAFSSFQLVMVSTSQENNIQIDDNDNDDPKPASPTTPNNNVNDKTTNSETQIKDKQQIPYSWKDQWYTLTYASYVPNPSQSAETTPAAVFGHPLVLWREQDDGPIYCADDVCPHRATALTEGRVRNGRLECLYHGWQWKGQDAGNCVRIPQVDHKAANGPAAATTMPNPRRSCLKMRICRECEGMLFVWMGDGEPTKDPPSTGILNEQGRQKGFNVYDFMIDLPYDHSFLVENLLDPAHIAISHDRTPGGGKRELAEGYEMYVDPDSFSPTGFTGKFRQLSRRPPVDAPFTQFAFEAPGIIRNSFDGELKGRKITFRGTLHCMPVGVGRSRLFFRVFNSGLPRVATFLLSLKPLWLRHLNSCKVLEQDVGLITTQEDHFARHHHERALAQDYLLVKTSDAYVGAYRKWLDRVGHGMPWFHGLVSSSYRRQSGSKNAKLLPPPAVLPPSLTPARHRASNADQVETRYHRHVINSPITRTALRNVKRIKWTSIGVAGVSLSTVCAAVVGTLVSSSAAAATPATTASSALRLLLLRACAWLLPISLTSAVAMQFLEQEFYTSFKRKRQLQTESGLIP